MPYIQATYQSGYVHSNEYYDVSPYALNAEGKLGPNIFNDILHKRPEAIHGRMVEFALVADENTYRIDWTTLPDNARPIFAKDVEQDFVGLQPVGPQRIKSMRFGYQYTDENGKNIKEVKEL